MIDERLFEFAPAYIKKSLVVRCRRYHPLHQCFQIPIRLVVGKKENLPSCLCFLIRRADTKLVNDEIDAVRKPSCVHVAFDFFAWSIRIEKDSRYEFVSSPQLGGA